jgi:hypothetical protein
MSPEPEIGHPAEFVQPSVCFAVIVGYAELCRIDHIDQIA